jgi:hypothetical protein
MAGKCKESYKATSDNHHPQSKATRKPENEKEKYLGRHAPEKTSSIVGFDCIVGT